MKNMVTVTVKMPWLSQISDEEYRRIYMNMMRMARDDNQICHAEAGHIITGMQKKDDNYSYDEVSTNINFDAYADLSLHVPGQELYVQISKSGEHVQTDPKTDARYYNVAVAQFGDGKLKAQLLGHLEEPGNLISDAVRLEGSEMKRRFADLKEVVLEEAAKNVAEQTKPIPQVGAKEQTGETFSL